VAHILLDALREHTRPHHQAIEQNRLLSEVVRPTLTRDVYVEVLARFYGFMKPLEHEWLRHGTEAGLGAFLKNRMKTGLLEHDLAQMGVPADALCRMPQCTELPSSDGLARCLGILYVIEGSTLGGQMIAAAVKKSLGVDSGSGGAYFAGYGASTGTMWKETCRVLEEYGQDTDTARAETVAAAAETFDTLHRWFQEL